MTYLSFGGFRHLRPHPLHPPRHARLLRDIANPAAEMFSDANDWAAIESYRAATAERLMSAPGLLPSDVRHRAFYRSAFAIGGFERLRVYADAIPPEDELEQEQEYTGPNRSYRSTLRRQAQLTVLAFKTASRSAQTSARGFDTHTSHDPEHEWLLGNLTDGVDYLWDYAEDQGVADRMVVVIGSDFGRTNFYNAVEGKDHWPIGSFIVMEKNQRWTGRAVGETDGLHFAQRIDPRTLRRDDAGGTIIYPKHVHKALRRYLGIEHTPGAQRFPFNNTEDFAFFGLRDSGACVLRDDPRIRHRIGAASTRTGRRSVQAGDCHESVTPPRWSGVQQRRRNVVAFEVGSEHHMQG